MRDDVSIRPEVSILSVLRHLNYEWWFALAEFVDNALASYLDAKDRIREVDGVGVLSVKIERLGEDGISIVDNAGGIRRADLDRALKAAAVPPDRSGLSEFGMGMKSAACWCGRRWSVFTSALGEDHSHFVEIDVESVVQKKQERVLVVSDPEDPNNHFTRINIHGVDSFPAGRTIGKIRSHMRDIYRHFLRNRTLNLSVFGEELEYSDPAVLNAPCAVPGLETQEAITWRRKVSLTLSHGRQVDGWVAIRQKGSQSDAGLSLFRRNRVILGTHDTKYRPPELFGSRNSYRSQRVFGELHLHGFEATHTKDGVRWDGAEHELLDQLALQLGNDDFPLLRQAEEYRVRAGRREMVSAATKAIRKQDSSLRRRLPASVEAVAKDRIPPETTPQSLPVEKMMVRRTLEFWVTGTHWRVVIELSDDPSHRDLFRCSATDSASPDEREATIRLSIAHPFVVQWVDLDVSKLELLIRLVVAMGVAEQMAVEIGGSAASARRRMNDLLRSGLHKP